MNRSRVPIVIVLIVSLLGAHFTRRWAIASRNTGTTSGPLNVAGLSRMNSFALALMLGGLRGPLVMFLWPSAERQKNERNLEDFDTKIEWIRLLQAEFVSVHIFQMWNKAYNISVQMANVGNKYVTILDALEYGRNVDAERPNDINIISEIARLFSDKLGASAEKDYYRQRVLEETRARRPLVRVTIPSARRAEFDQLAAEAGLPPPRLRYQITGDGNSVTVTIPKTVADLIQPKLSGTDVTFVERAQASSLAGTVLKRRELDPILDSDGRLLPQYTTPKYPRPADLPADSEWNDGSELQYLRQFEPFPYGVSPLALGYNYYKRAQVLQTVNKQSHVQTSDVVVDRNPPIFLKAWALDERELAQRSEIEGLGLKLPAAAAQYGAATTETMPDAPVVYRSLIDEAIYGYNRASNLIDAATVEYRRHMAIHKSTFTLYIWHLDEMHAMQELIRADCDFLKLMVAPAAEQGPLRASAVRHYAEAVRRFRIHALKYWTEEELAVRFFPAGVTKMNIDQANLDADTLNSLFTQIHTQLSGTSTGKDEYDEFSTYISRAMARLSNLGG